MPYNEKRICRKASSTFSAHAQDIYARSVQQRVDQYKISHRHDAPVAKKPRIKTPGRAVKHEYANWVDVYGIKNRKTGSLVKAIRAFPRSGPVDCILSR